MRLRAAGAVLLFSCICLLAQNSPSNSVVPKLIPFNGTITDASGKPPNSVVGVTFSLYKDEQGGVPLWIETQNVQLDATGHYAVSLGATKPDGLPLDLFASGVARWLGVQPERLPEQPRVLLLAVPYALKAADAETVGGLPPSAFVLSNIQQSIPVDSSQSSGLAAPPATKPVDTNGATINFIPLWTSTKPTFLIGNSNLFQSGSGSVGIGTSTPTATLDVAGSVNSLSGFNLGGVPFAFGAPSMGNVLLGFAGNAAIAGSYNTASGVRALLVDTTGNANTANGFQALLENAAGSSNTAVGVDALLYNTSGNSNTAIGSLALFYNITGSNNTAVGFNAGPNTFNLSNATAIGAGAVVSESNALVLGSINGVNGATASVNVGIGTATPTATLDIVGPLKIEGSGNGIVFPDGSTQTAAAAQGAQGPQGPQGPPGTAATIAVGTTSTGAAGTAASVTNVGTSSAAVFNFVIPQGLQGIPGPPGYNGCTCSYTCNDGSGASGQHAAGVNDCVTAGQNFCSSNRNGLKSSSCT